MSQAKQVVLASNNQHKLRELRELLKNLPVNLLPQTNWKLASATEDGCTFLENALIKARHACSHTELPSIADDSGLVVPSLNGEPGIRSARYAGEQSEATLNNQLLLRRLFDKNKDQIDTRAYFCAVLVYMENDTDPMPEFSIGIWNGQIIRSPRGSNGFGYDPIFKPDGMSLTAAELEPEVKNRLSHRAQASQEFVSRLKNRLGH